PAAETRPKAGPRHLVYHPGGKLVYVNGETDGNVYVFDYNTATGDLKQKQVVSALPAGFTGKPSTADMHITPDGKFLLRFRAHQQHARGLPGRRGQWHPHADRQCADREAAARLRHRSRGPLSAGGRPALARPVELLDRSVER